MNDFKDKTAEEQTYELSEHNLKAEEESEDNKEQLINKAVQLIVF